MIEQERLYQGMKAPNLDLSGVSCNRALQADSIPRVEGYGQKRCGKRIEESPDRRWRPVQGPVPFV